MIATGIPGLSGSVVYDKLLDTNYFLKNFGKNPSYTIRLLLDNEPYSFFNELARLSDKNKKFVDKYSAHFLQELANGKLYDVTKELIGAVASGKITIGGFNFNNVPLKEGSTIHKILVLLGRAPENLNETMAGARGNFLQKAGQAIGGFIAGIIQPVVNAVAPAAQQILGAPATTAQVGQQQQQQQPKKSNTTMWLIIGGAAVILILVLLFAFSKK